ncbi:hypothetical protein CCACVL1_09586, partial [Corchorus capsularis]
HKNSKPMFRTQNCATRRQKKEDYHSITVMPDKLNFKPVKLSGNQSDLQRELTVKGGRTSLLGDRILSQGFLLGVNIK